MIFAFLIPFFPISTVENNQHKQAPQDVASMARQEYRDFSEMDFDDAPPAPPQRKKSLESTPVTQQQPAAAAQGNFFDTLDWNDGKVNVINHLFIQLNKLT